MSNAIIQLIVLAGVALFLIFKLRSVLGTREGFERPPEPQRPELATERRRFEVIEGGPDRDITDLAPEGSDTARALAAMKAAEPSFKVADFVQGARGAYEMILMAFNKGEVDRVRPFLAPDVADAFQSVVDTRAAQGLVVEAEFLGIREVQIEEARFTPATGEAEITMRFVGELVSAVRDAAGNVVEGDPKSARKQRDVWTFERMIGSADPNWRLVATEG